MITLVLFPGMDGTGELFERFIGAAPPGFRCLPIRLPQKGGYDDLEAALAADLPPGRFSIVAESFSGPLAIRLARKALARVDGIVFSNTFASRPRGSGYALLPWKIMFRASPPRWVIRRYLLGRFIDSENLHAVRDAARRISPAVMAQRVRAALGVNDLPLLAGLDLPMLYLRGTEDRLVLDRSVEAMRRANASLIRCDIAAPHLLLQTAAADAWSHIVPFIMSATSKRGEWS